MGTLYVCVCTYLHSSILCAVYLQQELEAARKQLKAGAGMRVYNVYCCLVYVLLLTHAWKPY